MLGLLPMGWAESAREDRLLCAATGAAHGIFWNDDVVVEAPDGTEVLARTPDGDLQAARYAPTVWGLQLHPEVDEAILRAWAEEDPDRYAEGVLEDVLARISAARSELDAGWRPLAARLARLSEPGAARTP
ncbi:MAG: hypothetical protein JOZ82_12715 [Marmoricola sp.]|nr:hypothetical protein [Marmoricola sp.]